MIKEFITWIGENPVEAENVLKIIAGILTSLGALLGIFLKYFLDVKKEKKVSFENSIGSRIEIALNETRKMERQIRVKELYDISQITDEDKRVDFFASNVTYPGIFYTPETFFEFQASITEVRKNYEELLTYKEAALLLIIENYCMNVLEYAAKENIKDFRWLGAVLSEDLWKWHLYFDKVIVKEYRHARYKLVSHSGTKWSVVKKYIKWRFWQRTILCGLKENKNNKRIMQAKLLLSIK